MIDYKGYIKSKYKIDDASIDDNILSVAGENASLLDEPNFNEEVYANVINALEGIGEFSLKNGVFLGMALKGITNPSKISTEDLVSSVKLRIKKDVELGTVPESILGDEELGIESSLEDGLQWDNSDEDIDWGDQEDAVDDEYDEDEGISWDNENLEDDYSDKEPVEEDKEDEEENKEDEEDDKETESEKEINKKIIQYYYAQYDDSSGILGKLLKDYKALYASGYDVNKPFGIMCKDGIVGLSGNERVVKSKNSTTEKFYNLFKQYLGNFKESESRSIMKISNEIYIAYTSGEGLIYFPNKMLEFAYGRKAPTKGTNGEISENKDSLNTYEKHADSSSWDKYSANEVRRSLLSTLDRVVIHFIRSNAVNEDYCNYELSVKLGEYLEYVYKCLSFCIIFVNYKFVRDGYREKIASFKIRVNDVNNLLGNTNLTDTIIGKVFTGKGDVPFSYQPRFDEDTLVKEYAHEFNHNVAQAMPLFAYKAYDALKAQGQDASWQNMILGLGEDDSILRCGKDGINLSNTLAHFITAGSRAGKGVMTLNTLASAIVSGIPVFYLDDKPDMSSLLKAMSPDMFSVNGTAYNKDDDKPFYAMKDMNSMVNPNNIPDYLCESEMLSTNKVWYGPLGDLFYMRALLLVLGIIYTSAKVSEDLVPGTEKGIVLIVDEFTNFQSNYSKSLRIFRDWLPSRKMREDRSKVEEMERKCESKPILTGSLADLQSKFDYVYNEKSYYALTYLNALDMSLRYVDILRNASFNEIKKGKLDIFVIGQALDTSPLSSVKMQSIINEGRYNFSFSKGVVKSYKTEDYDFSIQSIPLALLMTKQSDSFYGRNMEGGRERYLAQKNPRSHANGRLDERANMFAYCSSFDKDTIRILNKGSEEENIRLANSMKYFKPFLVLNTSSPEHKYVDTMFNRCYKNANITKEEIISENTDDGVNISDAVGFDGYLKRMGVTDYAQRLGLSGQVANYVVKKMGYKGNWLDFITDLRPEWIFTLEDVEKALLHNDLSFKDFENNEVTKEFYAFSPNSFGASNNRNGANTVIGDELLPDEDKDYNNFVEQQVRSNEELGKIFIEEDSNNEVNSYIGEDEDLDIFDSDLGSTPDENIRVQSTIEGTNDVYKELEDTVLESKDRVSEADIWIENLRKAGYDVSSLKMQDDLGDFDSPENRARYEEYESKDRTVFTEDDIEYTGENSEEDFRNIVEMVTDDIISKFGGLRNIHSFKVLGESININGYYYRCKISPNLVTRLPLDLKREINSGNISKLFDYGVIMRMTNLRDLEVDSVKLAYDYVAPALGINGSLSVDDFFIYLPSLQILTLGRNKFTKGNYKEKMKENDIFYTQRSSRKFLYASESLLGSAFKKSWSFTKDVARRKEYGLFVRTAGVILGTTATVASGLGNVTSKAALGGQSAFMRLGKMFSDMKRDKEEVEQYMEENEDDN